MQWLQKIFRKKANCKGIVGISFLPQGMTIAVSNYMENNSLKLVHCEFVETKKVEERWATLNKWVVAYKLSNYDCHLVLDINDYQRINIEAPTVPENEIALAIRWKINELVDFPIDDAVINYYPVPEFNHDRSMLEVIASPHHIIKLDVEQCTQAGLCLKVIDIQETTLRNLAVLLPKNQLGVAVLHLQKTFGIILIQKNSVIYLARKIAIGYEKLDLESQFSTAGFVSSIYDNLALEIQRSLDYVESYYRMGTIAELAVIPWEKSTQNLVDKLNNDYGITAYLMDLSAIIDCDIALDYLTQSLCAPVIGATLRNTLATPQVNLYQDSFKQKQLDVRFYLLVATVFAFFFVGFSLINIYLIRDLRNDRELVKQTLKKLDAEQARVKLLQSKIPKQEIDTSLVAEVELWQKKMNQLKQTVAILTSNDTVRSQGFSAYFQALANQPISEVWLTMIHFDAEQQLINFEGSSFKADKIPYFLQQLQKEPVFHGRTFAALEIQKAEQVPKLMNFKLSTHLEPLKKDHVE